MGVTWYRLGESRRIMQRLATYSQTIITGENYSPVAEAEAILADAASRELAVA
jgi:hypothetical protein